MIIYSVDYKSLRGSLALCQLATLDLPFVTYCLPRKSSGKAHPFIRIDTRSHSVFSNMQFIALAIAAFLGTTVEAQRFPPWYQRPSELIVYAPAGPLVGHYATNNNQSCKNHLYL